MNSQAQLLLTQELSEQIATRSARVDNGHCLRIDDVNAELAARLCVALTSRLPEVAVHVLRATPQAPGEIHAQRAVEIRNRKEVALILIIPYGEGHAASSLDNSFERLPIVVMFERVEDQLMVRLQKTDLGTTVRQQRAYLRPRNRGSKESWAEFLAELCADPTDATLGQQLWRVGLVPDFGHEPARRLERNRLAVQAISSPSRPASTMDERLTNAGLEEGAWRATLRRFCDRQGARLANPISWTQLIALEERELGFETWRLAESLHDEIETLEVAPFTRPDGTLDKASKLKLGVDGQLLLEVPENGTSSLAVSWKTFPQKIATIARWELEVIPPEDLRTHETSPLHTVTVGGGKRRATLKIGITEDSLQEGSRFVVKVTALGEHGESVSLTSGEVAAADSQEFQILAGQEEEPRARRTAATSVPEAALRAAQDGLDDLTQDLVSWDLEGQVFGLRLGNRRSVQVRVCEALVRLQRIANAAPDASFHFRGDGQYGTPIDVESFERAEITVPPALRKTRAEFLSLLHSQHPRDTIESASWDDALRFGAQQYAASFKRALDSAEGDLLEGLLLMDTVALDVRRSNHIVHASIVLPLHPLRLLWASTHYSTMMDWAAQLTELTPKSARASMVDVSLAAQVVPANLPFSVPTRSGSHAVYVEELTYGSGLYIVPDSLETEAAADAVCSVLGLERTGASITASASMVGERLKAYRSAHDPGGSLRVLAVNPGSGEMLGRALASSVEDGDSDAAAGLEIVCYTDSATYTKPVNGLADLQADLRKRQTTSGRNYLAPALSLRVRTLENLLEDENQAHVSVIQGIGTSRSGMAAPAERHPSFKDLLVPLVTERQSENGDLIWVSLPATGPGTGGGESDLTVVHRTHQRAIGRLLHARSGQVPSVEVTLDGEHQARIQTVHDRSDWVIGLDRFIGVDLYEGEGLGGSVDSYILDYAPDFVEGVGDRLTVTTNNRDEVEHLLADAMTELGLAEVQQSVGNILSTLAVVSGRLALRLLENSTMAREAVSLAAVVDHLRQRGDLENIIVVPVDAHHEIFGASAREEGAARRCDLLLVRLGQRSFKIECVEVKSRKEARLPQALADHIVNQLEDTKRVLESRFFAADPPRIDGELQRARLASLLHYYADRSEQNGLIAAHRIGDIHRYIDRIEQTGEAAEITMRGYVISLDGDQGFKKRYGDVPMSVLTAEDLGRLGMSTQLARAEDRASDAANKPEAHPEPRPPFGKTSADSAPKGLPEHPEASPPQHEAPSSVQHNGGDSPNELPPESEEAPPATEHHQVIDPSERSSSATNDEPSNQSADSPHEITVTLGQDSGGGPVQWRVSTKGSPHAFVLGIPGQGKSVTTRKIIRDFAAHDFPALVFDFHGDMAADPPAGAQVLDAAEGLPFSPFDADVSKGRPINTTAWEIAEVVGYVAKLGTIQQNHVYKALSSAYEARGWVGTTQGDGLPTMVEFAEAVESMEKGAAGKNARARMQPLTDFGLFAEEAVGGFQILDQQKRGWIIDISRLGLEEVQRFAASFILRRVYREMFSWQQDGTMKLAVVLDEAHRMARDVTLPKIMKEGRKYGVGVVVASQSADDFHSDVLGNAGTKIVFRTNYPASKGVSGFLRGRSGLDLSSEIERLDVGVAFVSTPDSTQARKVFMDE